MVTEEDEEPQLDLASYLNALRQPSGLSTRALATAMKVDRSNVQAWLNGKGGMRADTFLLFLSAVGAEISPAEPSEAPEALNAEVRRLRLRLEQLEEGINRSSAATTKSLHRLEAAIESLSERLPPQERPRPKDGQV